VDVEGNIWRVSMKLLSSYTKKLLILFGFAVAATSSMAPMDALAQNGGKGSAGGLGGSLGIGGNGGVGGYPGAGGNGGSGGVGGNGGSAGGNSDGANAWGYYFRQVFGPPGQMRDEWNAYRHESGVGGGNGGVGGGNGGSGGLSD
jgi:hypothetical protein